MHRAMSKKSGQRKEEKSSDRRRNKNWMNKNRNHFRKRAASDSSMQNEIEAQLRLQRAKKAAEASTSSAAESSASMPQHSEVTLERATLGNYIYDPVRKAYFPRSSAAGQVKATEIDKHGDELPEKKEKIRSNYSLDYGIGPMTNFSLLSHVLLTYNVPLCNSPRKRHVMYDVARGLAAADGARVVPTSVYVCKDDSNRGARSQSRPEEHLTRWQTILAPVEMGTGKFSPGTSGIPVDCLCKIDLHPSAPTFDVLHLSSRAMMPSIVSMVPGGHAYRPPTLPAIYDVQTNESETSWGFHSASMLEHDYEYLSDYRRTWQQHAVRFASSYHPSNQPDTGLVGALYYDPTSHTSIFRQYLVGLMRTELTGHSLELDGEVNNFAFSKHPPDVAPDTVAFAVNRRRHGSVINFLAVDRGSGIPIQVVSSRGASILSRSSSDMLCVEFLGDSSTTTVYGHRNGSLSMIDHRSGSASFVSKESAGGFITSVLSTPTTMSSHLVIAKGSFASNFVFDIRKMGHSSSNTNTLCESPSLLHTHSVPENAAHQIKSSACSGLALDPAGTIVVSPFIDSQHSLRFGVWTLETGKFVKSLPVNAGFSEQGPSYCELSQTATSACIFQPDNDYSQAGKLSVSEEAWGLWFKCDKFTRGAPKELSGIQHLVFAGKDKILC